MNQGVLRSNQEVDDSTTSFGNLDEPVRDLQDTIKDELQSDGLTDSLVAPPMMSQVQHRDGKLQSGRNERGSKVPPLFSEMRYEDGELKAPEKTGTWMDTTETSTVDDEQEVAPEPVDYSEVTNTDETYTHRFGGFLKGKNFTKTYKDVDEEYGKLDPATNILKTTEKYRKMAARTTEKFDSHYMDLETYFAFVDGGAQEVRYEADTSKDPTKLSIANEAAVRAKDIDGWRSQADVWADDGQVLTTELVAFEESLKNTRKKGFKGKKNNALKGEKAKARVFGTDILDMLKNRETSFVHKKQGKQSKLWVEEHIGWQGVLGSSEGDENSNLFTKTIGTKAYMKGKAKSLGKKTGSLIAGAGLEYLTGGLVSTGSREVEGGRDTRVGLKLMGFVDDWRSVQAQANELRATKSMGGKVATEIYIFLKLLSQSILPLIKNVATTIAFWATLLMPLTGGYSALVAGLAATIGLLVIALKVVIDLVLTAWATVKSVEHKDKNPMSKKLANSEAIGRGTDLAIGLTSVGTGGLMGSDKTGKSLSMKNTVKSRFKDLDNSNKYRYGSKGFGAKKGLGIEHIDDVGSMSKLGSKLTTTGVSSLTSGHLTSVKHRDQQEDRIGKSSKFGLELPDIKGMGLLTNNVDTIYDRSDQKLDSDSTVLGSSQMKKAGASGKKFGARFQGLAKRMAKAGDMASKNKKSKKSGVEGDPSKQGRAVLDMADGVSETLDIQDLLDTI